MRGRLRNEGRLSLKLTADDVPDDARYRTAAIIAFGGLRDQLL